MTLSVLSIIICTKNRRNDLESTLHSVFLQSQLPDSIIVVDDSVTQETEEFIQKYSVSTPVKIIYIHPRTPHTGLPSARNTGIRHLLPETEIILFLDDDVTLEKTYLESLQAVFVTNPEITGCTGFIDNGYSSRPGYEKILLWIIGKVNPVLVPVSLFMPSVTRTGDALGPLFKNEGKDHIRAEWLSGSNMAYRRQVFREGHLFDEQLIRYAAGEDMLFSHTLFREGKHLVMAYNARLIHHVSPEDRVPPLTRFVMVVGYRRYILRTFFGQHQPNSVLFRLFTLQYITAKFVLSLKNYGKLDYWKQALMGYKISEQLVQGTDEDDLSRINEFCNNSCL